MNDTFLRETFNLAKEGNKDAIVAMLKIFKPILYKNSCINGHFNEDYFQELCIRLIYCIKNFEFTNIPDLTEYFRDFLSA